MRWYDMPTEHRAERHCASAGCNRQATCRLEAGGVGSDYCTECADKIKVTPERPMQTDAKTPVVVVGSDRETGTLLVVGLYETAQKATEAIQGGDLPTAFYSIVTPPMNGCLQGRSRSVTMTNFDAR